MTRLDSSYLFTHQEYLTDAELGAIYLKVQKDGLADVLFYSGIIGMNEWVKFIRDTGWLVKISHKEAGELGVFWLNGFQGRSAMIHVCMWRKHFPAAVESLLQALAWVKKLDNLDSLYGLTPKPFKHVLKLMDKLGFEKRGELPGACCISAQNKHVPGIISVYDFTDKEIE